MYFDTHAHIDVEKFDIDRNDVINDPLLSYILNPSYDLESSYRSSKLAAKYDKVYSAVGIHPHDASTLDDQMLGMIKSLALSPKVVAIGEIGLDFYRDLSPRDIQEQAFRKQIRLAKELGLPIIIHDRDSNQRVFDILNEEKAFETGVLIHSYSAGVELAREYVRRGAMLSISGPITYKNARRNIEVVTQIPIDHLVIETDSPYLTPEPRRGQRNQPSYVAYVCEKIAEIKGMDVAEVARITKENAVNFFRIKP